MEVHKGHTPNSSNIKECCARLKTTQVNHGSDKKPLIMKLNSVTGSASSLGRQQEPHVDAGNKGCGEADMKNSWYKPT